MLVAVKVDDKWTERMLTPELCADDITISQPAPKCVLGVGLGAAEEHELGPSSVCFTDFADVLSLALTQPSPRGRGLSCNLFHKLLIGPKPMASYNFIAGSAAQPGPNGSF